MNKFETIEKHLKTLQPSELEQEFLAGVDDAVAALMPLGHLDVESVAASLSIHSACLRRKLKVITDLTASNYFNVLRFRKAVALLDLWPRYTITQIGQLCGFADNAHFTHAFHRWMDTSPSCYVAKGK